MSNSKILFAASEAHPIIKTGGLADVCGALPLALNKLQQDVRLILPAYANALDYMSTTKVLTELDLIGAKSGIKLIEAKLKNTGLTVYLVDYPDYFQRPGHPYLDETGQDWPDNAQRYTLFCRAVAVVSLGLADMHWTPDLIHCNDWQTGLVPALLSLQKKRPATLFTIHNLAYQGLFPRQVFEQLELPETFWSADGIEFFDKMSCMKSGLVYADKISTVSPSYREQILTEEYGCGLEGILQQREADLHGVLNGIDYNIWDPGADPLISKLYSSTNVSLNKLDNKKELQRLFGLPRNVHTPLIGIVSRLVEQKGIDILIDAFAELMKLDIQLVLLGSGDKQIESALTDYYKQELYRNKFGLKLGYDETLSHMIEAGSDMFLMPSRFEPCGLNQMYSLRYGTIPIVRKTGGLADTVIDATTEQLENKTATGFVFEQADADALNESVKRAVSLYASRPEWRKLMRTAMQVDNSWVNRAQQYIQLYQQTLETFETGLMTA